jgi:hypothetical protein
MLEIPCTVGDDVWAMDEAQLSERCKADLLYTMNYRGNCNRIIDHLRILPDLVSCGRQGLFDFIFMDDAMLMGFEAARMTLGNGPVKTLYGRVQARDLLGVK